MNRLHVLLLALLSAACTVGPDYQRPHVELPDAWDERVEADTDVAQWWVHFESDELVSLIEESLAHNNELKAAVANVDAAAAVLRLARADYLPTLNAGVQASRDRTGEATDVRTEHRAGLFARYEFDIFGRIRRANEAALARLKADAAVRDGVRAAVAASVANAWFEARALERQIALLERVHEMRRDDLRLQQTRLDAGLISSYDFEQARSETAAVASRLPALHAARLKTLTALAVLRGVSPREMMNEWSAANAGEADINIALPAAPRVPMDLPSRLLERRPDIRAAEQRLVAANARIGEAKAAYFPRLSLTGFAGGVSTVFPELFDSAANSWEASVALAQPLTDLNRAGAGVNAARARHDAATASYALAVQAAFRETLDALAEVTSAREVMQAQRERVDALTNALQAADSRYRAGSIGYLDLLDVERQLRDVEQERVAAQLALLQATVDLYRALGGGWQQADAAIASRD